jgi:DNA repair protein RecN (Recombination protein N)
MLHELRVENLLLLERAELELSEGLNVVTGETGAGKTLLAQSLDLLLGGRARAGLVRAGAAEAYVEGVFSIPAGPPESEVIPEDAEEIVLARRVWPDGRTRAYVCGRTATVGDLREFGSRLLAFYGQHEHRKLMLSAAQLEVLDGHCGAEQLELRRQTAQAHTRARTLEERVAELRELAAGRERELDLLAFELGEIEATAPTSEEAVSLTQERDRLRHLETLRGGAAASVEALSSGGDAGARQLLALAAAALEPAAAIDAALGGALERLQGARYEIDEVASELYSYLDRIDSEAVGAARLEEVEQRLALFARLERKHGGSIEDVLRHAELCRARIDELEHSTTALGEAETELAGARAELDRLSGELSRRRKEAAPRLAREVRSRLEELAMPDAGFEVEVRRREDGCGPSGADVVELLIAPNPGVPAGPLKEIASGGELSRVMLALLSVAHTHGREQPLLVFDEIDAGIGGHTARAVGEHLRSLAADRQVLCITHLPQVAALAERHFTIAKDNATVPATTTVAALGRDQIVGELVRMLGAGDGDRAASQHARQLLRQAA